MLTALDQGLFLPSERKITFLATQLNVLRASLLTSYLRLERWCSKHQERQGAGWLMQEVVKSATGPERILHRKDDGFCFRYVPWPMPKRQWKKSGNWMASENLTWSYWYPCKLDKMLPVMLECSAQREGDSGASHSGSDDLSETFTPFKSW